MYKVISMPKIVQSRLEVLKHHTGVLSSSKDKAYLLDLLLHKSPLSAAKYLDDITCLTLLSNLEKDLLALLGRTDVNTVRVYEVNGNEIYIKEIKDGI